MLPRNQRHWRPLLEHDSLMFVGFALQLQLCIGCEAHGHGRKSHRVAGMFPQCGAILSHVVTSLFPNNTAVAACLSPLAALCINCSRYFWWLQETKQPSFMLPLAAAIPHKYRFNCGTSHSYPLYTTPHYL